MLGVAVLLSRRQLPRLAQVNLPSAMALLGYLIFFSFAVRSNSMRVRARSF